MRGLQLGALAWVVFVVGAAAAADSIRLPDPGSDAWQPLPLRGVERKTLYEPVSIDGIRAVRSFSDCYLIQRCG